MQMVHKMATKMLPNSSLAPVTPMNVPQLHALDPQHKNILPLESALVPYQPPKRDDQCDNNELNFNIL